MANQNFSSLRDWYTRLKTKADENRSLWDDIANLVGIRVDPDYKYTVNHTEGDKLDQLVDDPTAALSVNQAGDYLLGLVWGSGDDVIDLEPTDDILQLTDEATVAEYYRYATKSLLSQMNHSNAGLSTALKPYMYDQVAFGTSGVGAYLNDSFNVEGNALIFRNYGIDNMVIDEGKNGLINVVFVTYNWRPNRVVSEFAYTGGKFDQEKFDRLPQVIKDNFETGNVNDESTIIQAVFPRDDFDPRLAGKRGARYKGAWFLDGEEEHIFLEEDYEQLPIAVARAIKIRGEVYGRSSGSLLISTIKSVNYMVGKTIAILEKMEDPALGTWNNAVFGDTVIDTSSGGLVVFNDSVSKQGGPPVFNLHDVGDPSGVIQFLIPYLNEKITTGFKVDLLLDFNSAKDMTATESLQRFVIRGKSLAGLLQQQKIELLERLINRCVSLLDMMNLVGIDPTEMVDAAEKLRQADRADVIIPDAVLKVKKSGRPWYKIRFNNELEKLSRTQALENIIKVLNVISAMGAMFPTIVQGVEWFQMWKDVNDYLGTDYAIDEKEFKAMVERDMKLREQAIQLEAAQSASQTGKNVAQAQQDGAEANG
jgi:hypothetical protein